MLAQLAVSMALELDLHRDVSLGRTPRKLRAQPSTANSRTTEERRAMLAVFHLSSA